jgi:hypothetical protein
MKWKCWSDWTMEISFYHLAWLPYKLDFLLSLNQQAVKKIRPLILGVILALSYSRTLSLWYGYYAPMQVYQHLPVINDTSPSTTTTTGILSSSFMSMKKFWFTHYAGAQMVLFYSLFIWEIAIFQFGVVTLMTICFDQIMLWDNDADSEMGCWWWGECACHYLSLLFVGE